MKNLILYLLFLIAISGCKKETSEQETATNYTEKLPDSFTKRVLLEEYSKHCPFCIPLNAKIDSMRNAYPNNTFIPVIISTNHSTEIDYFDTISGVFTINSTPSGSINRVPAMNSGLQNNKLVYNKEYWGINADRELGKTADFGLKIKSTLSSNLIDIEILAGGLKTDNQLKLSVFIIENDQYYRILKQVVTDYKGSDFGLEKDKITTYNQNSIDLSGYNISKTSVIAFLHYFDQSTQNFEIVNVQEVEAGKSSNWN